MKTQNRKFLYFLLFLISIAFYGCDSNSGQIEILTKENTELKDVYQEQLAETRIVTKKADSLHTVVNKLSREVNKLKGEVPTYNASSADEKAIEALVQKLHQGWTNMCQSKNTNDLLQYFLPRYTAGAVRINTENVPSVKRSNDSNFEEHLGELVLSPDLSLTFGQTRFLYTEVKGNYFVTSYRTRIRVYEKNKEVHTSSIVNLLAGENRDGWKVGSYNWVTFNY
jgi:hypothetical protein